MTVKKNKTKKEQLQNKWNQNVKPDLVLDFYHNIPFTFTGIVHTKKDSYYRWFDNGELHRLDGPAVVSASQHILCEWWVEGMRHRLDGPAHISSFEEKYYINNVQYSIEDYMKHPLTIKFTMNSILDQ